MNKGAVAVVVNWKDVEIAKDLLDLDLCYARGARARHLLDHQTVEQCRDREGAQIGPPPGWTRSHESLHSKITSRAKGERTTRAASGLMSWIATDSALCSDPRECGRRAMRHVNPRRPARRIVSRWRRSMGVTAVEDMEALGGAMSMMPQVRPKISSPFPSIGTKLPSLRYQP